jgi:hypothetical protein
MKTSHRIWENGINLRSILLMGISAYLILSFFGVNQSNLGAVNMSGQATFTQNYSGAGSSLGYIRNIRSDEFLRSTPMLVGFLQDKNTESASPLTVDTSFAFNIPTKISDYIVFPEYVISKFSFLSVPIKFSFLWWLPIFLLFVSLVLVGDSLGNSKKITLVVFGLLLFSPGSAWWSNLPVPIFYNFLLAFYFLVRKEKGNWFDILSPIISGFFVVRAISYYQPWALVFGSVVILTGVVYLSKTRPTSNTLKSLCLMFLGFMLFLIIRFYPHLSSLRVLFQTVYPGQRVSTGGEQSLESLFSTPYLWRLQFPGLEILNTNQSEITSFLIIPGLLIFIFQFIASIRNQSQEPRTIAGVCGGIIATLWLTWAIVNFTGVSQYLFLVNKVPGYRAAQIVGSCFIFLLLFLYPTHLQINRLKVSIFSLVGIFLTFISGVKLQKDHLPQVSIFEIVVVSLFIGILIYSIFTQLNQRIFVSLSVCFIIVVGVSVNPVNIGLGEFDGKISEKLSALDSQERGIWAANNFYSDSLLMSKGIKAISGQQATGPAKENWRILDPDNLYETNWNRASSYITFQWSQSDVPQISNPSPDVILISVNPCSPLLKKLELEYFISLKDGVAYGCAKQLSEFQIMGQTNLIYKMSP